MRGSATKISFCFILVLSTCSLFAQKKVLIAYYSQAGATAKMAEYVASGVKSVAGVIPVTKPIQEVVQKDLLEADAIIVGTPVYNAMVSSPVVSFISTWPFENQPLKNKVGAVFVTAGGISAGEELAQMQILQSMMVFGMIVVGGDEWTSAFGASAVMQEGSFQLEDSKQPAKLFLDKAYGLGKRVATLTQFIQ
ncbi:MAG: hypothetical protein RL131_188, partial [Bacteroidota bacterium]